MLKTLFRGRPQAQKADALYIALTTQARQPAFYTDLGVADRIDARFELFTLHAALLIHRLKAEGEQGAEISQRLFDTYVAALDDVLRELGVGDLSVAKKMRKLGEALYGRLSAYEPALDGADEDLAASLARNILESDDPARGQALARYALASRDRLAGQSLADLTAGPAWAEIAA